MRKLVSMSAVLFVLVGIFGENEPADALPPCSCAGCATRPNMTCVSSEDGGIWMPCSNYFADYCTNLSAPATGKVAVEAEFFSLVLQGAPAPDGRLSPLLPVVKPGC